MLLTADSIVHDGNLDVADELGARTWRQWHDGPLEPTARPDDAGRIAEPHGAGLPLLQPPRGRSAA